MLLEIQCLTVNSFLSLLNDCASGKLTEKFQPVRDELRDLLNNDRLEIEVFMYENDALESLKHIGNIQTYVSFSNAFVQLIMFSYSISFQFASPNKMFTFFSNDITIQLFSLLIRCSKTFGEI